MPSAPFTPSGDTVKVAATTTSGSVALGSAARTVRVYNASTSLAHIALGAGAATASATGDDSIPMAAGATEVFSVGANITHAAALLATGTGDVYFTPGDGF